jgi:glyoxylase-like metal-dependent hydrolase (beta-lactamase superfamily II)
MLIYEKIVEDISLIRSDSSFWFKCQGIVIKNKNSGNILIDCNCFYKNEIENLLKDRIEAYFVSHVHLDHVYNLHYYEEFNPNIKIYCPIPENEYLKDFNNFVRDNGTLAFGIGDSFKKFAFKELGFKEIKSIIGFSPETEFKFDTIKIKAIPIPGHSLAQSAYSIEDTSETSKRKILFVSDIGLRGKRAWAWHGFKYSNLGIFRESIKRIEKVYLNDDYIIASSHGPIIFEKQPDIFNDLLIGMEKTENAILNMLDPKKPKGIKDLMFKGLIFPVTVIKPIEKGGDSMIIFFENNMILHHINDLLERGKIIDTGNNQWISNK